MTVCRVPWRPPPFQAREKELLLKTKALATKLRSTIAELKQREKQCETLSEQAGNAMQETTSLSSSLEESRAAGVALQKQLDAANAAVKDTAAELQRVKAASGNAAELAAELQERDSRIEAILKEAEGLSKKQVCCCCCGCCWASVCLASVGIHICTPAITARPHTGRPRTHHSHVAHKHPQSGRRSQSSI